MENDYSNVAGATLLESLFTVDILLPILLEFRNIFLEEHFSKVAEPTCSCFDTMTLHSGSHQRCCLEIAVLKGKVVRLKAYTFIKKRLQHSCFPVYVSLFWKTSRNGCFCTFQYKGAYQYPVKYLKCFCQKLLVRCILLFRFIISLSFNKIR